MNAGNSYGQRDGVGQSEWGWRRETLSHTRETLTRSHTKERESHTHTCASVSHTPTHMQDRLTHSPTDLGVRFIDVREEFTHDIHTHMCVCV